MLDEIGYLNGDCATRYFIWKTGKNSSAFAQVLLGWCPSNPLGPEVEPMRVGNSPFKCPSKSASVGRIEPVAMLISAHDAETVGPTKKF